MPLIDLGKITNGPGQDLERLLSNSGARLSEVGGLMIDDADLNGDSVRYHDKGPRTVVYGSDPGPFGR